MSLLFQLTRSCVGVVVAGCHGHDKWFTQLHCYSIDCQDNRFNNPDSWLNGGAIE